MPLCLLSKFTHEGVQREAAHMGWTNADEAISYGVTIWGPRVGVELSVCEQPPETCAVQDAILHGLITDFDPTHNRKKIVRTEPLWPDPPCEDEVMEGETA